PAPSAPGPEAEPEPPAPPPRSITGMFFTRYELRDGYARLGKTTPFQRLYDTDGVAYRARLGLKTAAIDLGDGWSSYVYFEPQGSGLIDTSGSLADPNMGMHQGALTLVAPAYSLQVGRFEMAYGEHLIIGSVPWHQTGRAFDGARLHIAPDKEGPWGDLFITLIDEGADGLTNRAIGAADHYFAGTYLGLGPALGDLDLDAYLLSRFWLGGTVEQEMMTSTTVDPAAEMTLGSRLKGAAGVVDYRAEAGVQFGARKPNASADPTDVFAFQVDGELGVKPVDALRLAAHGWYASGDDPTDDDGTNNAWAQLYPTAHKFMGLSDVMGARSNLAGGALIINYAPAPSVKLTLDAQAFVRPEVAPGEVDNGYAATEVDTGLVYAIGPGLIARAMYAILLPNEDVMGDSEPAHFLEVEVKQVIK
ncbi:MAG: alginate export family protein, partial [Myxococcales bacterium]|nr:alginate export family protein [Myxococcales bacterium]